MSEINPLAMERAKAGDAFLMERDPEYWKKVDLATLDLSCCTQCVLGQLFGDYTAGVFSLGIVDDLPRFLGFNLSFIEENYMYDTLGTAWTTIIREHQERGA